MRFGPSYQHAVFLKANEEFATMWLTQLKRSELPVHAVLCALATANKDMPHLLAKEKISSVWMKQAEKLAKQAKQQKCTPEDLARATARLSQMPKDHAADLVEGVAALFAQQEH